MIRQFARYCLVGALNTGVGLSIIFLAMIVLRLPATTANFIGFAAAFLASYALNRRWTFQSARATTTSLPAFALVCAIGYALNITLLIAAIDLAHLHPYLAQLVGVGAYALFVFIASRQWVFRH